MGSNTWYDTPPNEEAFESAKRCPAFEAEPPIRFALGDVEYAALPGVWYGRLPLIGGQQFTTAIPTDPASPWTKDKFSQFFDVLRHEDDVSEPEFRKEILFCGTAAGPIEIPCSLRQYLHDLGLSFHVVEIGNDASPDPGPARGSSAVPIPGGAYLWSGSCLRPLYRLYEDKQSCLMHSFKPTTGPSQYSQMRIAGRDVQSYCVAVPSRIPGLLVPAPNKPLAGKRILVKDVFDVRDVRMTLCDKAFYNVSSPASKTAPVIQTLVDNGATLVGTARLSSMISWEEPSECVDYQAPFNPRGDGMQSPAGSSSGSAAAIASYEWFDFAIGTDSTGSCRRPAMVNGCFGSRISTGALSPTGMVPCFPLFDTPAVFARDICDLGFFVKHWRLKGLKGSDQSPTSIIAPLEFFDSIRSDQQKEILEDFIKDMSRSFNFSPHRVSLRQLWEHVPPADARGQSLCAYLQDVGRNAFFFDYYHSTDGFRQKYFEKHGTSPPVNKMTSFRWETGSTNTEQQRIEAGRRLEVYKKWLLSRVLCGNNPIMVIPIMDAEPKYRDDQSCGNPTVQEAWDQLWLSPVLGAPEVTVPIGHIPYHSKKTHVEEMLPVAISILGLPRTDMSLIETVEIVLRKSDRPLRVAVGREMFVDDWEVV